MQYRVSADNVLLSGLASNLASNPPLNVQPIDIFRDSGKTRAWVKDDGSGYVVIMQAPWIFNKNSQGKPDVDANQVFNENGEVITGAEIGMELQINACAQRNSSISRDAILTWNGVTSQAYQNVRGYGTVTLLKH